jgi:branched-chain amino acid transport system ATP-binding protein
MNSPRKETKNLKVPETLLQVQGVHTYYGNIHALRGVSLEVRRGEIVTIIGNNGAGKSTLLSTISGLLKPREGRILLGETRIDTLPAHKIVWMGVSQAPEGRQIFSRLTVKENLLMGAFVRRDTEGVKDDIDYTFSLFPRLRERSRQTAGTLSGGEQQMLAISRALMARPKLLLLDETSMGLAPLMVETIFTTVHRINSEGTTILLVEQNALIAFQVATRGYVTQTGEIVMEDSTENLRQNEMVRQLYLGASTD